MAGVSLLGEVAVGGQKSVFEARRADGSLVILKVVDLAVAPDPAALERAKREVGLLNELDSAHVVRGLSPLHSIGTPSRAICWLEERLEGDDLRAMEGVWLEDRLRCLAADIAAGIGALHERHIVHRDLSPGNVMCLPSGRFVVIDPGTAKHSLLTGITIGGQPGTRGFMSPEHIQSYSGAPTAASDVFAAGALVYFAATGGSPVPYKGDDAEYISRLRTASHRPLAEARPDLSSGLVDIVERALHAQPARRFRNGRAMRDALDLL